MDGVIVDVPTSAAGDWTGSLVGEAADVSMMQAMNEKVVPEISISLSFSAHVQGSPCPLNIMKSVLSFIFSFLPSIAY